MAAPQGYRTLCAYIACPEAAEVLRFAQAAFDARLTTEPLYAPGGRLVNAQLEIGDGAVMLGAPMDGENRITGMLHLYVADCDAAYARALGEGAESRMPPADQLHGDRAAMVADAGGNLWWIAQRIEALSHEELAARISQHKGR